jgi:hypothetical protein
MVMVMVMVVMMMMNTKSLECQRWIGLLFAHIFCSKLFQQPPKIWPWHLKSPCTTYNEKFSTGIPYFMNTQFNYFSPQQTKLIRVCLSPNKLYFCYNKQLVFIWRFLQWWKTIQHTGRWWEADPHTSLQPSQSARMPHRDHTKSDLHLIHTFYSQIFVIYVSIMAPK